MDYCDNSNGPCACGAWHSHGDGTFPQGNSMTTYVAGFRVDSDGFTLLIEKLKPAWQAGKLNGIGGKIEPGEVAVGAMVREFEEETGIATEPSEWTMTVIITGKDFRVYFFMSRGSIGEWRQMEAEQIRVAHTLELPVNVISNLRWLIPLSLDNSVAFPIEMPDRVPAADSTGT